MARFNPAGTALASVTSGGVVPAPGVPWGPWVPWAGVGLARPLVRSTRGASDVAGASARGACSPSRRALDWAALAAVVPRRLLFLLFFARGTRSPSRPSLPGSRRIADPAASYRCRQGGPYSWTLAGAQMMSQLRSHAGSPTMGMRAKVTVTSSS